MSNKASVGGHERRFAFHLKYGFKLSTVYAWLNLNNGFLAACSGATITSKIERAGSHENDEKANRPGRVNMIQQRGIPGSSLQISPRILTKKSALLHMLSLAGLKTQKSTTKCSCVKILVHIVSVFLGAAETIVGSFVCCGVGTILNKATNKFFLSALRTEAGQRSSLLISPSRDIAKQQRNNRLKDTVGHHELLLKRV
ncbi:unnamed protein product [Porites evermanni]|uniref:Uncharacterized protein n=1 Tax=Porites evermanni TaxID=104178 RepID=A0ABN8LVF4_9CNID|nr:unnamed protein product [Porites evermanni]